MSKTKKQFKKYTIAFENREAVLLENDYKKVNRVTDKADLLICKNGAEILIEKPTNNTYFLNVSQ